MLFLIFFLHIIITSMEVRKKLFTVSSTAGVKIDDLLLYNGQGFEAKVDESADYLLCDI